MKLWVPAESDGREKRVAIVPDTVPNLKKLGFEVWIQPGAGTGAGFSDEQYQDSGARIQEARNGFLEEGDVAVRVSPPYRAPDRGESFLSHFSPGSLYVGFFHPLASAKEVLRFASRNVDLIAVDMIPRITRAQNMDALSSQTNLAGYRAVINGVYHSSRVFPLMMTAAGTVTPARVVILGAGVAGLQALATAKRLGAVVEVSDVRLETREQVESLGGRFIAPPEREELKGEGGYAKQATQDFLTEQRRILTEHLKNADVVITTAQVPGKRAPILITEDMVQSMKPGSVIVDMAAGQGGNCELTEADREIVAGGVHILGDSNITGQVAYNASQLYSRNLYHLLEILVNGGRIDLDREDEILKGSLIARKGRIVNPGIADLLKEGGL